MGVTHIGHGEQAFVFFVASLWTPASDQASYWQAAEEIAYMDWLWSESRVGGVGFLDHGRHQTGPALPPWHGYLCEWERYPTQPLLRCFERCLC